MTLRMRFFIFFIPLTLITLILFYLLAQQSVIAHFDAGDTEYLNGEASRLHARLEQRLRHDLAQLSHYAHWDESYLFMRGQDPGFLARNVDRETLEDAEFDFIVFLDKQGTVYAENWLIPKPEQLLPIGPPFSGDFASVRQGVYRLLARQQQQGYDGEPKGQYLSVQGVPLALLTSAISDNSNSRPAAGTLALGRFLKESEALRLRSQLASSMALLPPQEVGQRWTSLPTQTFNGNQVEVSARELVSDDQHRVLLMYRNSLGEPQLTVELKRPRRLFLAGSEVINVFMLETAAGYLGALLLLYLGLELTILRRLSRLRHEFAHIGPNTRGSRLNDNGADNIGDLARAANQMLERLELSDLREQEILNGIHDGYLEIDRQGRIQSTNPAMCHLLGYQNGELQGIDSLQILPPSEQNNVQAAFARAGAEQAPAKIKTRLKRRDGSLLHCEGCFSQIRDSHGTLLGHRGILRDNSEQMAYQNQLLGFAYCDALTGLGNRQAFSEYFAQALEHSQQTRGELALLYLDLDRFKQVNDTYGHDIGDALLQQFAERMRQAVRQPDCLYRLGGDEFTLVLPNTDIEGASTLANRLLKALQLPVQVGTLSIDFVTPSIGIALYPQHAQTAEDLTKAADEAMYQAKAQRNRVCLYQLPPLSPAAQTR